MTKDKVIQNKLDFAENPSGLHSDTVSDNKYFAAFSNFCIQNPLLKAKIFEYFDYDIKRAFECNDTDLRNIADYFDTVSIPRNFLSERDKIDPDRACEECMAEGVRLLTYNDEKYPKELKSIPDFPLSLYYKGDLDGINFNRAIAFVGSRKATIGAKEVLAKIISEFKGLDIVIVSGLAEGIDTVSHKSALQYGLKTVAVIGSGFNYKYPVSNKKLYDEIEQGGGVIFSEYPYKLSPLPYLFPLRNRIVTGMSFGTVVGEARLKSGAMISANMTLDQGKELMCIPGIVSNPNTEGIYRLLKNGASLVTSASDILEALNWEIELNETKTVEMTEIEKKIYEEISLEPRNIEELQELLNIPLSDLMVNLTSMELKGLIKLAGGNYFVSGS